MSVAFRNIVTTMTMDPIVVITTSVYITVKIVLHHLTKFKISETLF
jgi:hypothetical protein